MTLESPSLRMAALGLGLTVMLGAGTFVMAQTGAAPPAPTPEQRLLADQIAKRLAEREAIRAAERMGRLEGRIVFLRTRLQITPAQTPLWDTFAQALRNEQAARNQAVAAPPAAPAGAAPIPERLARRSTDLAARAERLLAVTRALTPLYAALNAEQKAIADRSLRTSDDGGINIVRGRNRGS